MSPHHSYLTFNDTEEQYHWNLFQNIFFQMMNNKNIDSQSESTRL